ncbi:LapA family protein [Magnetococcus sp. PR-3]|uniref:LapA family protein n=1 Tax=Magnetococcus sp. PR-3 TaxID=3120355 RepID=UPI002FCE5FDE
MFRLLLSLIITFFLLIFSSQNMHDVEVRFVFGEPVEMPLILALAGAFIGGFGIATFSFLVQSASGSKKKDVDEF